MPQFGTSFTEMDALSGRQQTTRGIWMALSPKLQSQVGGTGHDAIYDNMCLWQQQWWSRRH